CYMTLLRRPSTTLFPYTTLFRSYVLLVEKEAVWSRFNEDKYWKKEKCMLIHGGGQPPRGVRRLVHRMHNELELPVYVLVDNDPRSEEHTSELQSRENLVCRLLLE